MPSPPVVRTWSCACGDIQCKLSGDPILIFNCHCHSCVGAARHIQEVTTKAGHSSTIPILTGGGAAVATYAARQVDFTTPLSTPEGVPKVKFVRNGEKGAIYRSYTTCCGTQLTNCVLPGLFVPNRNGIKNEDGTPFEPPGEILNTQKKHAFEPDKVPEPSHNAVPLLWIPKFVWPALTSSKLKTKYPELFPNPEEVHVEVVPITW